MKTVQKTLALLTVFCLLAVFLCSCGGIKGVYESQNGLISLTFEGNSVEGKLLGVTFAKGTTYEIKDGKIKFYEEKNGEKKETSSYLFEKDKDSITLSTDGTLSVSYTLFKKTDK
ncbi:MAG: hypothetical protein MJ078_03880 [Clostridia bacterium]|nr:hypothetical protein [Clostridia bacterium]